MDKEKEQVITILEGKDALVGKKCTEGVLAAIRALYPSKEVYVNYVDDFVTMDIRSDRVRVWIGKNETIMNIEEG